MGVHDPFPSAVSPYGAALSGFGRKRTCLQRSLVGQAVWMKFDDRNWYEGQVMTKEMDVLSLWFADEPQAITVRVEWSVVTPFQEVGVHSGHCKRKGQLQMFAPT